MTPDLTEDASNFIMRVPAKHARQILLKIIDLCGNVHPNDAQPLKNSPNGYWRVDIGEYRTIYREQAEILEVLLIGKRNDDEVYRRFSRKEN